jgi:hypothetical protein
VFRFTAEQPYVIAFSAELAYQGEPLVPTVHWGPALGDGLSDESSFLYSPPSQPIFYQDGDVTRVGRGDIPNYSMREGQFGFVGADDHYFISAALPRGQPLQVRYQAVDVPAGHAGRTRGALRRVVGTVSVGAFGRAVLLRPQGLRRAQGVDRDLVRAIHFGIFSPIVVPLLRR